MNRVKTFTVPAGRNPFASRYVDALRFRDPNASVEGILARWEACGFRGMIVGEEGTGKTTLLGGIASELERRGWTVIRLALRLGEPRPVWRVPKGSGRVAVLLDSAGCLPQMIRRFWRWKGRRAAGWIETAHARDNLPVIHETRSSDGLFADLVEELAPGTTVPAGILARHGGNIRMALREMYDRISSG